MSETDFCKTSKDKILYLFKGEKINNKLLEKFFENKNRLYSFRMSTVLRELGFASIFTFKEFEDFLNQPNKYEERVKKLMKNCCFKFQGSITTEDMIWQKIVKLITKIDDCNEQELKEIFDVTFYSFERQNDIIKIIDKPGEKFSLKKLYEISESFLIERNAVGNELNERDELFKKKLFTFFYNLGINKKLEVEKVESLFKDSEKFKQFYIECSKEDLICYNGDLFCKFITELNFQTLTQLLNLQEQLNYELFKEIEETKVYKNPEIITLFDLIQRNYREKSFFRIINENVYLIKNVEQNIEQTHYNKFFNFILSVFDKSKYKDENDRKQKLINDEDEKRWRSINNIMRLLKSLGVPYLLNEEELSFLLQNKNLETNISAVDSEKTRILIQKIVNFLKKSIPGVSFDEILEIFKNLEEICEVNIIQIGNESEFKNTPSFNEIMELLKNSYFQIDEEYNENKKVLVDKMIEIKSISPILENKEGICDLNSGLSTIIPILQLAFGKDGTKIVSNSSNDQEKIQTEKLLREILFQWRGKGYINYQDKINLFKSLLEIKDDKKLTGNDGFVLAKKAVKFLENIGYLQPGQVNILETKISHDNVFKYFFGNMSKISKDALYLINFGAFEHKGDVDQNRYPEDCCFGEVCCTDMKIIRKFDILNMQFKLKSVAIAWYSYNLCMLGENENKLYILLPEGKVKLYKNEEGKETIINSDIEAWNKCAQLKGNEKERWYIKDNDFKSFLKKLTCIRNKFDRLIYCYDENNKLLYKEESRTVTFYDENEKELGKYSKNSLSRDEMRIGHSVCCTPKRDKIIYQNNSLYELRDSNSIGDPTNIPDYAIYKASIRRPERDEMIKE